MKKILLTLALLICTVKLNAQVSIDWQKCLGGSGSDEVVENSMIPTSDGGYILSGRSSSNDGDVAGNHGSKDAWIVKFNATNAIQWKKCFGGNGEDHLRSILETADGGYILSGSTYSNDGDVSGNHGGFDGWVVKINAIGTILWQKCFGGTSSEYLHFIKQTSDGGYILSGNTYSNNGDASGNHGDQDSWLVKINATGTIQWQKCLGGSGYESVGSILPTSDGGYIVLGGTESNDGDVSGNHGLLDSWVVKINATGTIQWQKCLGGSAGDGTGSILSTSDGGYIILVSASSNDGDVSGNHGGDDVWVVKINATGNIQWQKCLGGSLNEYIFSFHSTSDGGYILSGYTHSNDGDVSGNHGEDDAWVVKINATGNIQWQKCFGGIGVDYFYSILQTSDGGYVFSGQSKSNDGDVSGNHGGTDIWVVKLADGTNNLQSIENVKNSFAIYPNPANTHITLDYDGQIEKVEILDLKGATVYSSIEPKNELNLPQNIQSGYYTVVIQTAEGVVRKELMIQK